jgi:outer membrane protein TolC
MAIRAQVPDSTLTVPEAIRIAMANYNLIKAKQDIVNASALEVKAAKQDGLPDFIVGVETAYGTLNGMNGFPSGEPGLTTVNSGPATPTQNWNAAFGALYLTNINWNLYSFGLQRAHVAAAKGQYQQDRADLRQQQFQQQVQVTGAYLSLLAAQQVRMAMEDNLLRATQLRDVILQRTQNGLNPGVDSSIANAEVSKARLSVIDARNYEQQQANQLSIRMGITPRSFQLDTSFAFVLPKNLLDAVPADPSANPTLQFLASRVTTSDLFSTYIRKTGLPRVSLFGLGQDRGSGFGPNYGTNSSDYSQSFIQGIQPYRANYLVGIGLTWDITDLGRSRSRANAQRLRSSAFNNEYLLEQNNLINHLTLSDQQIRNALAKYQETPVQLRSAEDAFTQKKALYENGLTTIIDVAQTLFILNSAEIDRGIACNAVWQAILFKAATAGDLNLFLKQL